MNLTPKNNFMKLHLTKTNGLLILLVTTTLIFFSCQKNISYDIFVPDPIIPADLSTKVNSTITGFVTDENNAPVLNANVTAGNATTTTNRFGFFEIKNVQVVQTAAVVTVQQPGYFKGIKTYIATADKAVFFRIKLLPKTNAGTIAALLGGTVTTANGLKITLPANAVVNATTNAAYAGPVKVAAKWIDPTSTELNAIMPGDLRGIDLNNGLKLLTTYGMAAVELTGNAGEVLQIATGKKATLNFPIPAAINGTAPASIPLWSFNETNGLWKQEGIATKTGTEYMGEVSHFSFWNCDVPNNYVQFNCTLKDASGNPLSYLQTKISVVSNPAIAGYGLTDSNGYVSGAIPNNSTLKFEVFTSTSCGTAIYSQTFTTTNANLSLGIITINLPAANFSTVSGTVTNCANAAVTNGRVFLSSAYGFTAYGISSTGAFSFTKLSCSLPETAIIIADDFTGLQQSTPLNITLVQGSNSLGNLQACGITTQRFFNFTINGTAHNFTAPADSITQYSSTPTNNNLSIQASSNTNNFVFLRMNNTGIGVNSTQILQSLETNYITDTTNITTPINVTITEYGNAGQFMSGNFTGTLTKSTAPFTAYNIVCSFRVRRQ